ncbi:GNAT family N-acetyltransferase [Pseudochrobactrum asaccharolyticum]|uniref:GNAT family N-acetyltransferase n=1 Tax=Pseudochrobactrum asaccharolyticum TaxID=354351 RepID=UPI0040436826
MTKSYTISDLKARPEFLGDAADRVWNAWWRQDGHELDFIKGLFEENLTAETTPVALIAHDGAEFLGTASLINSDMEARPQYTPWVAALWVDEKQRSFGIGSALIKAAIEKAREQGFAEVYLCAEADKHDYYAARDWVLIEENIDDLNIYRIAL